MLLSYAILMKLREILIVDSCQQGCQISLFPYRSILLFCHLDCPFLSLFYIILIQIFFIDIKSHNLYTNLHSHFSIPLSIIKRNKDFENLA